MIFKINDINISEFIEVNIDFNFDSVSDTFSITLPYFEHWLKAKKIFKPLSYQKIEIFNDRKTKLMTGTILNSKFKSNAKANEMSLSGYSITGILDDCPNIDETSTNYVGMTILQLATKLFEPYKINIIVSDLAKDDLDSLVDQTTTNDGESISAYLSKMCSLKNVVMRSTPEGAVLFTKVDVNQKSIVKFSTGDGVVTDISLDVNGQNMHSQIKCLTEVGLDSDPMQDKQNTGNFDTITNPLITSFRPTIKKQGTDLTTIEFPKLCLADELKNISIRIECKGWEIVENDVLVPGDEIEVKSSDCYLYNWTKLIVRSISMKLDADGKKSSITCVLPEVFNGENPKMIFDN